MITMRIVNPATEEVIIEISEDTPAVLDSKTKRLRAGQVRWAQVSISERVACLRRYSVLLDENRETLSALLTSEVGKPLQQSRNEINGARSRMQWLLDHAEAYLAEEIMSNEGGMMEKITYEPLGVICNISAWNYPWLVGVNIYIPALLAGNAVIYKPSEYATLTGLEMAKLLYAAGIPEDVFQVAIGAKAVGEQLLEMDFDGYFFTGSYKTGLHIYQKVSSRMIPCQCELGGKDPLYVADDVADIAAVAAATADGAFYNNGQSCCAVERIYVHQNIYDDYLKAFLDEVRSWKTGNPLLEGVYIGPLARKAQLEILEEQVRDAMSNGARLETGGKRMPGPGWFFEPTVLTRVNNRMKVMQEESFGPIIGIMPVGNDEEALSLMQETEYGLTASVYSSDRSRAEKILNQVNAGTGYWNCCDRVSAAVPWSGRKHSGIGSTLSHAGLRAFTKPKGWHLKD